MYGAIAKVTPEYARSRKLMKAQKTVYYLSCEHASKFVPAKYRSLFRNHSELLNSHRGWDPGAERVAEAFQDRLGIDCVYGDCSRLFVELNRSLRNKNLFSFITRPLPKAEREQILDEYYFPYRETVASDIGKLIKRNYRVVHLSIHTFTPVLNTVVRETDLSFLYNPGALLTRPLCETAAVFMNQAYPKLRTRLNYPYRGTVDCMPTYLQRKFSSSLYVGMSIEVNQKFFEKTARNQKQTAATIADLFVNGLEEGKRVVQEEYL